MENLFFLRLWSLRRKVAFVQLLKGLCWSRRAKHNMFQNRELLVLTYNQAGFVSIRRSDNQRASWRGRLYHAGHVFDDVIETISVNLVGFRNSFPFPLADSIAVFVDGANVHPIGRNDETTTRP